MLPPAFAFEVNGEAEASEDDSEPDKGVTHTPVEFGHDVEVHAVEAGDEGEGDEDGGDDGEDFHDLVHFVADGGEVEVEQTRNDVAEGFDGVYDLDDVFVDIAQIEEGFGMKLGEFTAIEAADDFAQRPNGFAQVEEFTPQLVDILHGFGGGVFENVVFDLLDVVAEVFEDEEVVVYDGVEEGVGQVVGSHLADTAVSLSNPLAYRGKEWVGMF